MLSWMHGQRDQRKNVATTDLQETLKSDRQSLIKLNISKHVETCAVSQRKFIS